MTLLWAAPAAVKALFATALDPVPVYDAADIVGDDPHDYLSVGHEGEDGGGVTADQSESDLSGDYWRVERGEIACALTVWDGDTGVPALRQRAEPLLTACIAAIKANRALGGLLGTTGRAEVTRLVLAEGQSARGAVVTVSFTVTYNTLLT